MPPPRKLTFWALCFCHWSKLKRPILKKGGCGPCGKQTFAFRPRWPKNRPNRLLRDLFGHLGPPRGPPGARAQFFLGPVGAPRGRAAAQGGPLGGPFGALVDYKNVKKPLEKCGFAPQRGPRRAPGKNSKNCRMSRKGRPKRRGDGWGTDGIRWFTDGAHPG